MECEGLVTDSVEDYSESLGHSDVVDNVVEKAWCGGVEVAVNVEVGG